MYSHSHTDTQRSGAHPKPRTPMRNAAHFSRWSFVLVFGRKTPVSCGVRSVQQQQQQPCRCRAARTHTNLTNLTTDPKRNRTEPNRPEPLQSFAAGSQRADRYVNVCGRVIRDRTSSCRCVCVWKLCCRWDRHVVVVVCECVHFVVLAQVEIGRCKVKVCLVCILCGARSTE